jgi:Tol biopolymer transport system component
MGGMRGFRSGLLIVLLPVLLTVAGAQAWAVGGAGTTATSPAAAVTRPPTAGTPGSIAFTRATLGAKGGDLAWKSSDIYVVGSDGRGLTKLAHGSGHSFIWGGVAWSPDGSRLAFIRGQVFDRAGLWVMNADGSGKRLVTRAAKAFGPGLAWSPGTQIVFSNLERADVLALLAVNADGSGLRHVTLSGKPVRLDEQPAWAPDGTVFFDREDADGSAIYRVNADGSGLTRITAAPQPTCFSLSPDGQWLLLWNRPKDALVKVPASGMGARVVLVEHVSRYIASWAPSVLAVASSWSPDGGQIAFASDGNRMGKPSALYIVGADGSGLHKVPNVSKAWNPAWLPQ